MRELHGAFWFYNCIGTLTCNKEMKAIAKLLNVKKTFDNSRRKQIVYDLQKQLGDEFDITKYINFISFKDSIHDMAESLIK